MHTNTDLFVEYTSFLEKSMQKMEHEKGHLLNDDNNTWLKKLWHFLQTLIHPDIYIKENTTGLILKKKIEFIPVLFIHDCIPEFYKAAQYRILILIIIHIINIFLALLYKEHFLSNIFLNKKFKVHSITLPPLTNSFNIQVFPVLYEYCWMDGLAFWG